MNKYRVDFFYGSQCTETVSVLPANITAKLSY